MHTHPANESSKLHSQNADFLLRESEARFRRLFETAQDGILILDAETGKITDVNQFLLNRLSYRREEILGKKLCELGFLKNLEASKARFSKLQRIGYIRYDDLPLETKSGQCMEVEFISNLYLVGSQRVIQCNIRDISKRKQLEYLKDNFLSNMSHEIRTPVSILKIGIDELVISHSKSSNKNESKMIEVLKLNTEKLSKLIENLLDLSRLESDKIKISLQTIQVDLLINGVIRDFQSLAKKRNILLIGNLEKNLPPLKADPDLLVRIFNNLLDNALRFAKSRIVVAANKIHDQLKVRVIDDGPGIKAEYIHTLFNKFVQINRPTGGTNYKGTGLGLAMCDVMIKLLDGRIWAESSQEDGSQFHFTIPFLDKTNSPALTY